MSLEDLIKEETGNTFKEKIVHYSKFTTNSIYRGAIDMFRLPTANRLRREAEHQRTPTFLEEVVRDSIRGSLQVFMIGSFLLSPPIGLTALATNIASYIYEKFFAKTENIQSIYKRTTRLKRWARNFAKFACTYTLVGSMALGHFFASSALRTKQEYNPNLLNVEVQKISLENEGKKYEFYLLGESHLYNYSSSVHVTNLIEGKNISLLLSEGVNLNESLNNELTERISLKELMKEQSLSELSWRNICEGLVGVTFTVTLLGTNYIHQEPAEICYKKGIPVIFLEKPAIRKRVKEHGRDELNSTESEDFFIDGREGVGDLSYVLLGASGVISVLYAPQMYFFSSSARYFPFKNLINLLPVDILFKGIIDERNKLMTEEAFYQIKEHSEKTCLMRVGLAHTKGILEEFKKYGEVSVEKVNVEIK